jgi:hypothetical protein
MKGELRRVKVAKNMSEETTAFTAQLWVDGGHIADVRNDGRGGANHLMPVGTFKNPAGNTLHRIRAFEAWCDAQPPHQSEYGPLEMTADYYVTLMLEDYEEERWLKRLCKKKTIVRLEGAKAGDFSAYNKPYSPRYAAELRLSEPKLIEVVNERFTAV